MPSADTHTPSCCCHTRVRWYRTWYPHHICWRWVPQLHWVQEHDAGHASNATQPVMWALNAAQSLLLPTTSPQACAGLASLSASSSARAC